MTEDDLPATMITIVQSDIGVQPFATDDEAVLRALKGYQFDLSYQQHGMFSGRNDREAYRQRYEHIRRLIFERDPDWDGRTVELFS